jgi:indolepyruvate ferredoxin oxidoreductase alpha subunit
VLDNRITAMTGRQDHPGTGRTAEGDEAPALDLVALCRALGVERVREVDPYDLEALETTLEEELEAAALSVIVVRAVCRLVDRRPIAPPARVTIDCPGCGACLELGCPGLDFRDGAVTVNADLCPGCGLCVEICPFCGIEIERGEPATVGAP